jgi:hypothetical protein
MLRILLVEGTFVELRNSRFYSSRARKRQTGQPTSFKAPAQLAGRSFFLKPSLITVNCGKL